MSRNMTVSDFYCTKCGRKGIPIARKQGQQREPGHLKKLYCLACAELRRLYARPSFILVVKGLTSPMLSAI